MAFPSNRLKYKALELQFNRVSIVRAELSPTLDAYLRWIDAGMHGTMNYMARPDRQARRRDLNVILPGSRSLIVVGLDYVASAYSTISASVLNDPSRGRIASYAWGMDYHDVVAPRLEQLAAWLADEAGLKMTHRVYVDTGALLERSHAQQGGLGFIGKNTMLIHPRRGSAFFLGEILTDLEFDTYDTPYRETMCGTCTRCLNTCPTDAFPQPYVLDARRCISYHTIENRGWIDHALRPSFGNWVFGCDICQDICPFQRFAAPMCDSSFLPLDIARAAPLLLDLLALDDERFEANCRGSPVYRIQRERLVRNACIAAGNWGSELVVPALLRLLDDASPLVRGHAVWALGRILGKAAGQVVKMRLSGEKDPQVQQEMELVYSL